MSSEDGEVYIMREGEDGDWVNPTPATEAILEAVVDATDLASDDLDDLEDVVDHDELRAVLEGEGDAATFDVADAEVTVSADGSIDVA